MDTLKKKITIWVDADACPVASKEILYRVSARLSVQVTLVANQYMKVPNSKFVGFILVGGGPDVADDKIVELVQANDLVITNDIPLAARAIEKKAIVLGARGEVFDENNIRDKLASRNLMEELRSSGMITSGPKSQSNKDSQNFANQLDRTLTKLKV